MKHLDITVKGRVQGVWFRKYTEEKANKLGIKGLVKNQPDGSVFIEAEGDENTLVVFVEWCYTGSPFSKVECVDTKEGEMQHYEGFRISRS